MSLTCLLVCLWPVIDVSLVCLLVLHWPVAFLSLVRLLDSWSVVHHLVCRWPVYSSIAALSLVCHWSVTGLSLVCHWSVCSTHLSLMLGSACLCITDPSARLPLLCWSITGPSLVHHWSITGPSLLCLLVRCFPVIRLSARPSLVRLLESWSLARRWFVCSSIARLPVPLRWSVAGPSLIRG